MWMACWDLAQPELRCSDKGECTCQNLLLFAQSTPQCKHDKQEEGNPHPGKHGVFMLVQLELYNYTGGTTSVNFPVWKTPLSPLTLDAAKYPETLNGLFPKQQLPFMKHLWKIRTILREIMILKPLKWIFPLCFLLLNRLHKDWIVVYTL